jgi:hypothetical protein
MANPQAVGLEAKDCIGPLPPAPDRQDFAVVEAAMAYRAVQADFHRCNFPFTSVYHFVSNSETKKWKPTPFSVWKGEREGETFAKRLPPRSFINK